MGREDASLSLAAKEAGKLGRCEFSRRRANLDFASLPGKMASSKAQVHQIFASHIASYDKLPTSLIFQVVESLEA
jgi:hypothetical protein